jgi:hypothetical protein
MEENGIAGGSRSNSKFSDYIPYATMAQAEGI